MIRATEELTGAALDLAVAHSRGLKARLEDGVVWLLGAEDEPRRNYNPSTNWGWAGPIIGRYGMEFTRIETGYLARMRYGNFDTGEMQYAEAKGPDHLVAAMRCVVIAELGEAVDCID